MAWKLSCLPVVTSANAFFRDKSPYLTPGPGASVERRSSAIIPEFYQGQFPPQLPLVPFWDVPDCLAARADRGCGQRRPATDHGLPSSLARNAPGRGQVGRSWRTSPSVRYSGCHSNSWPKRPAGQEQGQSSSRSTASPVARYLLNQHSDDARAERREETSQRAHLQKGPRIDSAG